MPKILLVRSDNRESVILVAAHWHGKKLSLFDGFFNYIKITIPVLKNISKM